MMGARTPEVVTGARGPASERLASAQDDGRRSRRRPADLAVPAGKVVFQASAAKYRLQLQPIEVMKGKQLIEKPRAVVFDAFLSKPYDEDKDAEIIQLVRESDAYGIDIWELGQLQAQAKKAAQDNIKAQIAADPEFAAAVREALQATRDDDFEQPRTVRGKAASVEA